MDVCQKAQELAAGGRFNGVAVLYTACSCRRFILLALMSFADRGPI
jgi:hypothetical protein